MKTHPPTHLLALVALTAASCAGTDPGPTGPTDIVIQKDTWTGLGQWLISALATDTTADSTCDENWINFACRGGSNGSTFETTQSGDSTPPGRMFTLFSDEGNTVWLATRAGVVYPGTRDGQTFTFSWEETQDTESTVQSANSLPVGQRYGYTRTVVGTSTTTISLTVDLAEGKLTGTSSFEANSTRTWTETDEWTYEDNDGTGSRLAYDAYRYLDVGYYYNEINRAYGDECSGNSCQLTITRSSTFDHSLSGTLVSADVDAALDQLDAFRTRTGSDAPPF